MSDDDGGSTSGPATNQNNNPVEDPTRNSDVLPLPAPDDEADRTGGDAELSPQRIVRRTTEGVQPPDLKDLVRNKDCARVPLTHRRALRVTAQPVPVTVPTYLGMRVESLPLSHGGAALGLAVEPVVQLRPDEQVSRIHARRVVASVENQKASGDGAIGDSPRESVRRSRLPVNAELPVSARGPVFGGPHPTRSEFGRVFGDWTVLINLRPELSGTISHPPIVVQVGSS